MEETGHMECVSALGLLFSTEVLEEGYRKTHFSYIHSRLWFLAMGLDPESGPKGAGREASTPESLT